MQDWFVTVLVSLRDMAKSRGMIALAEEMDAVILVAANEMHGQEQFLGTVDGRAAEHDPGEPLPPAGARVVRRYH